MIKIFINSTIYDCSSIILIMGNILSKLEHWILIEFGTDRTNINGLLSGFNMIKLSGLRYPEDIDIKITGLRPGEKLYEELLANGENTLSTYHQKIMISKTRELEYDKIKSAIEALCVTNRFQNNNIVLKMKELIPEYKSSNSDYEIFDRRVRVYKNANSTKNNLKDKTFTNL